MPLELQTINTELETDQLETRNKYRERLRHGYVVKWVPKTRDSVAKT